MIAERYYNILLFIDYFYRMPEICVEMICLFAEAFDVASDKEYMLQRFMMNPMRKVKIGYVPFHLFIHPIEITPQRLRKMIFPNPYFTSPTLVDMESMNISIMEPGDIMPVSLYIWASIRVEFVGRLVSHCICGNAMFVHTTNHTYVLCMLFRYNQKTEEEIYCIQVYKSKYSHLEVHHRNDNVNPKDVRKYCQLIYATNIPARHLFLDDGPIYLQEE